MGAYFEYRGKNSREMHLRVTGINNYASPSKKVLIYDLDGRDGSLIRDTGCWEDRLVTITVKIMAKSTALFNKYADDLVEWLQADITPSKLVISDNVYVYYMASCINKLDISRTLKDLGEADIIFECKPHKRDVDGDIIIDVVKNKNIDIINPYSYISSPVYKIYGTGKITLTLNGEKVTFDIPTNYYQEYPLIVDTDLMDVYKIADGGTKNFNDCMIGYWEDLLLKGNKNILKITGCTSATVIPRWRKI